MIKMITNRLWIKEKTPPKEYLPIHIKCILYDLIDYNDKQIHSLRDHCHQRNIFFSSRRYDSYKYSDDRNNIKKLPAFHVYINNNYNYTFYMDRHEISEVNIVIGMYNDKLARKRKKKEEWDKFYERMYNLFTIRYNQSLLDKTKAKEKKEYEKKRINHLEKIKNILEIEESNNKILIEQS
jgi:hypothetical protein